MAPAMHTWQIRHADGYCSYVSAAYAATDGGVITLYDHTGTAVAVLPATADATVIRIEQEPLAGWEQELSENTAAPAAAPAGHIEEPAVTAADLVEAVSALMRDRIRDRGPEGGEFYAYLGREFSNHGTDPDAERLDADLLGDEQSGGSGPVLRLRLTGFRPGRPVNPDPPAPARHRVVWASMFPAQGAAGVPLLWNFTIDAGACGE